MLNIVGINLRKTNKIRYFDCRGLVLKEGQMVIVEMDADKSKKTRSKSGKLHKKSNPIEIGTVKVANRTLTLENFTGNIEKFDIKKVIRIATEKDLKKNERNKAKEKDASKIFIEKVKKHKLKMKLIDTQIAFDLSKITFLFTSDNRIDFRALVKDLAQVFKTRIELRQIGARDDTRILNGIGICGRSLCCSTFLKDFQTVSIKMAKDQNLSLNPSKISGICGRLRCCLKYEQEIYEEFSETLPTVGDIIKTPIGTGVVISSNILRQTIKTAIRKKPEDAPSIHYFNAKEIEIIEHKDHLNTGNNEDESEGAINNDTTK